MPTQSTTYNTRLTDETLEKRFRDTFRSQSGAELVDDLYASGVIVPIVDFTAAAEGSALRQDLQSAWDFSTDRDVTSNTTTTIVNTTGFWKVDLTCLWATGATGATNAPQIYLTDGLTNRYVWNAVSDASTGTNQVTDSDSFIVFLRSGDSLIAKTSAASDTLVTWVRQIADVSGNFTNPLGFTSS